MQLSYLDQQLDQKRQIKLKTCADVYDYWRRYKRIYKKAPKDGVEFQIEYIDTGLALSEEMRSTAPIALALHGAPGSYHDFALLIQHLAKQNVRVIAPNFPEYAATVKTKVLFRHSADEKAAYLRDFLKATQVNKIDLLISHSSAMFPTLLILLKSNQEAINRQQQQKNHEDKLSCINNYNNNNNNDININDNDNNNSSSNNCNDDNDSCNECSRQQSITTILTTIKATKDSKNKSNSKRLRHHQKQHKRKTKGAIIIQGHDENQVDVVDNDDVDVGVDVDVDDDVIVKFDQPIEIKAVALFNPAGHRLPKSMKPTWFKCGSVRIYQHKLGRSLFGKLGPAFLTVVGVPVRVDNMDNVMLSATVMRNSRCHRVVNQLERLAQMRLPTLLVFSENDKLIEKEIFYEMTQFMKLDKDNFNVYEGENEAQLRQIHEQSEQNKKEDWVKVMVFKDGGHYTYSNYSKIVNEAVSELLGRVTTAPTTTISEN